MNLLKYYEVTNSMNLNENKISNTETCVLYHKPHITRLKTPQIRLIMVDIINSLIFCGYIYTYTAY